MRLYHQIQHIAQIIWAQQKILYQNIPQILCQINLIILQIIQQLDLQRRR